MKSIRALSAAALLLAVSTPALAQRSDSDSPDAKAKPAADLHQEADNKAAADGWSSAPVEERTVTTRHSIPFKGRSLAYTATAGTLTLRDAEGRPTASMFYTAYTLDGGAAGKRPVTFFYNGGPGSASFWLRMGSFGPMRVQTGDPIAIRPAPFDFGPNPDTLLDKTDMVFLDAIGTGYSRPLGDTKPAAFYGVDQDADAFATGIQRYLEKFSRWSSPKFLFGESYGTTRSGVLAYQLQQRGVALNGVVLLSSIMNYGARASGLDNVYIRYLPSYAATAWYHHKLADPTASVEEIVARARAFATGPYASALAKGMAISQQERDTVAQQMSALTGISPAYIESANLRIDLPRFQKELLRDRRERIGRFDSRYTGTDTDAAGSEPESDASDDAISGAFVGTFRDYLANTLNYKTDLPYRISARDAKGWTWDWNHRAPDDRQLMPDTAVDLGAAMRENPYLKVLSLNGYYDMATPFFGTEFDLNHMMLEPALQKNLAFRYYPAGHMAYLNPEALHAMKADLARFYDDATAHAGGGGAAK